LALDPVVLALWEAILLFPGYSPTLVLLTIGCSRYRVAPVTQAQAIRGLAQAWQAPVRQTILALLVQAGGRQAPTAACQESQVSPTRFEVVKDSPAWALEAVGLELPLETTAATAVTGRKATVFKQP
jgi:hypothetical protein